MPRKQSTDAIPSELKKLYAILLIVISAVPIFLIIKLWSAIEATKRFAAAGGKAPDMGILYFAILLAAAAVLSCWILAVRFFWSKEGKAKKELGAAPR